MVKKKKQKDEEFDEDFEDEEDENDDMEEYDPDEADDGYNEPLGIPKSKTKKKKDLKKLRENLPEGDWQHFQQQEFVGFMNMKTKEKISSQEAIRRILNYAEEAAINTR